MTDARSTHIPATSGGFIAVTGTLVIDTHVKKLQTIVAFLGAISPPKFLFVPRTYPPTPGSRDNVSRHDQAAPAAILALR